MPYLIDGHNLIAGLPDIRLDDPNDEAKLVNKLKSFVAGGGKKCSVVFDGGIPGGHSEMSNNAVKVTFAAAERSNADAIVKRRIQRARDAKYWIVVTSDHELLNFASSRGIRTMTSSEFALLLRANGEDQIDLGEEIDPKIPEGDLDYWIRQFGADVEDENDG